MLFSVVNLGCKVNRVENDSVAATLLGLGWSEAPLEASDLVVINTCTVTGEAEKKTRKTVRHAIRMNAIAPIVVTGCAAAITPELYESLDPRVSVISKAALLETVRSMASKLAVTRSGEFPSSSKNVNEQCSTTRVSFETLPVGEGFRTRVGVKVQDGCNNACTYCIVHVARGRSVSRPAEAIIGECVALASAGVREIVLTGINLGCFKGTYLGREIDLAGLLEILVEKTEDTPGPGCYPPRFRVGSIEPRNVDDAFIRVLANSEGRVARHLHLPLQSGSSKVLREMARPYTAEYFLELVNRLRTEIPSIALSTDIIAGFPGESDAEFEETFAIARGARFMKIHAFPYSMRTGTPAAARKDQVAPEVKSERCERLRVLSEELASTDLLARSGSTELALVEGGGIATLESYHTVTVSKDELVGSLIPITL